MKTQSYAQLTEYMKNATERMISMGLSKHLMGFKYLRTAVIYAAAEEMFQFEELYIKIGEFYHVSPETVKTTIRKLIDTAYKQHPEKFQAYFTYPISRPGTAEVLAMLADDIALFGNKNVKNLMAAQEQECKENDWFHNIFMNRDNTI